MEKNEKLMEIDFKTKPTYGDDDKNKKGSEKVPEEKIRYKCLSVIILDSVLYAYEKYHPQIFLEECRYAKENIKTKNYIDKEFKSESDSDSGTNNEE